MRADSPAALTLRKVRIVYYAIAASIAPVTVGVLAHAHDRPAMQGRFAVYVVYSWMLITIATSLLAFRLVRSALGEVEQSRLAPMRITVTQFGTRLIVAAALAEGIAFLGACVFLFVKFLPLLIASLIVPAILFAMLYPRETWFQRFETQADTPEIIFR